MHIKRRANRALLYRSSWVRKGAALNTHGYSTQTYVASLLLDAEELPKELENIFSKEEIEYLELKIFRPARLASEEKKREFEHRKIDPTWRLEEAARLVKEAALLSESCFVASERIAEVEDAIGRVRTTAPSQVSSKAVYSPALSHDPLSTALLAILEARNAVADGHYGDAPAEGVRTTHVYKKWAEIFDAVEGSVSNSLLRALQTKGFVKSRGSSTA
jgi:hypothetical protein